MIGWVLASMGYAANQVQSTDSQNSIVLLMTIIPGVIAIIAVFCIRFYPISDEQQEKIQQELVISLAQNNPNPDSNTKKTQGT